MPFEEGKLAEKRRLATRLGRYDPLIEAQARELTCLRQKIHEGKGVCHLFTQHAKNTIKTFESFLKSTGMTYYQRQRYCELLAQGSQLAERLASKLSTEHSPQLMRKTTKQAKSKSERNSKISHYFRFLLQFAEVSAL
ncbi:NBPF family member NBPF6-like protein [Odocoileus virginianus]|uniref:NBPF family member NBPF6-like protein n=1 Tax=Odocoileus virginianus TaxID=9874 RepID=A0ABM4I6C4_ODOVR